MSISKAFYVLELYGKKQAFKKNRFTTTNTHIHKQINKREK